MKSYDYVNTKMGSFNHVRYSNGNCYPVCAVPRGMNFYSIQTDSQKNEIDTTHWFYSPLSRSFEGIRLTHMPSPWLGDYGKLLIYGQKDPIGKRQYYASFDNDATLFEPSYIKLYCETERYTIELTPTNASAIIKFSFRDKDGPYRAVFAGEECVFEFDDKTSTLYIETTQCSTRAYYTSNVDKKLKEYIVIKPSVPCSFSSLETKAALTSEESEFEIKIATSYISRAQAEMNLAREIGEKTFSQVYEAAKATWEKELSKIEIEDRDEEKKKVFYSCMYRAHLWPRRFYELDENNQPIHINTKNCEITKGYLYVDNGFWDTFRTLFPYLSLINTDLYREIAEGFYNHYLDTGWLPKWLCPSNVNCMPGMLIEAVIGDAIVKEIVTGEVAENMFKAMLKDGEYESPIRGEGRTCLSAYRKYGYIPYTLAKETVNETLDNSFGDYCIAKAAEKLGHTDIADRYMKYSKNYANLFDSQCGFMRGKDENGNFRDEIFNPYSWGRDYTEGSAWQNSFGVYHDIEGLNELYGGRLAEKIDELMTAPPIYDVGSFGRVVHEMAELAAANYGQCAISNQPSFHIPFIYSELGHPEKTSYHVERLCKFYNSGIEGYPGDEDNGSASAWYMLAAMGLYQMAPSRPDFSVSVPILDKIKIKLANGNILYINKKDYDVSNMNGRVSYFDVMSGGELAKICKK